MSYTPGTWHQCQDFATALLARSSGVGAVTVAMYGAICRNAIEPSPIGQAELGARVAGLSPSSASKQVTKLERIGLVRRNGHTLEVCELPELNLAETLAGDIDRAVEEFQTCHAGKARRRAEFPCKATNAGDSCPTGKLSKLPRTESFESESFPAGQPAPYTRDPRSVDRSIGAGPSQSIRVPSDVVAEVIAPNEYAEGDPQYSIEFQSQPPKHVRIALGQAGFIFGSFRAPGGASGKRWAAVPSEAALATLRAIHPEWMNRPGAHVGWTSAPDGHLEPVEECPPTSLDCDTADAIRRELLALGVGESLVRTHFSDFRVARADVAADVAHVDARFADEMPALIVAKNYRGIFQRACAAALGADSALAQISHIATPSNVVALRGTA